MRLIKLVLISAVVLFGVITAIASLLPSHVRISRAVDIDAAPGKAYAHVADIKAWEGWNEFVKAYHNPRWQEDKLVTDEITITLQQKSDTLITAGWQQPSGEAYGSGYQVVRYSHDSLRCTVQWYFDFHVRWYPWEKFQSIVYDQQLGPVMEKSLQNLKRQVESQ